MAQGPAFRNFDCGSEEWELYKEQLEQYFAANGVQPDMKRAVLINHCEAKTYKLLRDLCTPDAPASKTYDELCTLLSKHFTPPVVVHKERRYFLRAKREEDESLNDWAARLKNLASNCKMGNHLQHSLLLKFIDGLQGKAYDRICEEDESLIFERAYEIAVKYEPDSPRATGVFQIDRTKSGPNSKQGAAKRGMTTGLCLACNKPGHYRGHYRRDCRFKEYSHDSLVGGLIVGWLFSWGSVS
ncbi:hypothetical protein RP20_CCG011085 [Aedes albopictus]|nr:hypothetical protein RP20_CCG011085 [Aedes albopictus]